MKWKPKDLLEESWDQYVDVNYWYLENLIGKSPLHTQITLAATYAGIGYLSGRRLGAAFGLPAGAAGRAGAMKGLHTLRSLQLSVLYSAASRANIATALGLQLIYLTGKDISYTIAGDKGVRDYNTFLFEPGKMGYRLSLSLALLKEEYL